MLLENLLNRYSSDFSKLGNILSLRNSTTAIGIASAEVIPPCPSLKGIDTTSTLTKDCDGESGIAIEQDSSLPLEEEHSSQHSANSSVTGPIHQKVPNLSLSNSESTMNDTDTLPTVPSSWEPETDTVDEHTSNDAQEIISPIITQPTEMIHTMEKSFSTSSFQSLLRRKKTAKKDSMTPNTYHQDSTSSTSSFASYLDTTTKHNRSTTTTLNRSKSKKKWSLQLPSKIPHLNSSVDPVAFMAEPRTSSESEGRDTNCTLTLMDRLLQSMLQGGCVTSKLHIPMDLW